MKELLLGCALLLAVGSTAVAQEKEIVQVSRFGDRTAVLAGRAGG